MTAARRQQNASDLLWAWAMPVALPEDCGGGGGGRTPRDLLQGNACWRRPVVHPDCLCRRTSWTSRLPLCCGL